jgi:aerotaxis receptor
MYSGYRKSKNIIMRDNSPVSGKEVNFGDNANILSTTDLKSHITYISDDFVNISGFSRDELIGESHNIVRHPTMPSAAFEALWTRVRSGKSWMGMVKNRCKNGDHYWVDAFATPIMKDGQAAEYQSVRVKPKRAWVDRAEALYRQLGTGKPPAFLTRKVLDIRLKATFAFAGLSALLMLGFATVLPLSPGALAMVWLSQLLLMGFVTQRLFAPLVATAKESKRIIDDPLAMHVYTGRHDEAGQIQLALKAQTSETGAIVGRINDFSTQVAGHVSQLYEASLGNVDEIQALYSETDSVAAATNEMSTSIQEVASSAQLAATSANEALENANEGRTLGLQVKHSINGLVDQVAKASDAIRQVGEDTNNISTVVDVIRSVAEQTNLLALNAAIEAARAGEQGRGFAVVADEVRTLATRTHQSTEEIMATIAKLQRGAQGAVQEMDAASKQAAESVGEVDLAVTTIEKITQSVDVINDMNAQTAAAVDQQSSVAEEINSSITRVKMLADNVMESSKRSSEACNSVNDYSQQLMQLAAQFWDKK